MGLTRFSLHRHTLALVRYVTPAHSMSAAVLTSLAGYTQHITMVEEESVGLRDSRVLVHGTCTPTSHCWSCDDVPPHRCCTRMSSRVFVF